MLKKLANIMNKTVLLVDTMSFGGSERDTQILVNNQNLGDNKLIVVSLANDWRYPINKDVETYSIYKKNFHALVKLFLIPITIIKVIRILKKIKPTLVISLHQQSHLHNIIASKFLKFKTITREVAYIEVYYGKKNIVLRPIISKLYNNADLVLVNDIEIKESLKRYYRVKTKIEVINNLLDISNFKTSDKIKTNKNFSFITIGRLSVEKNTRDLILAFKKANIENTVLEIIGDGPLKESLILLSKQLGIEDKVIFHGHQKDIMRFLNNANVFVFASLNEGFPNVVLEAMYCGLPVISYQFKAGITTILENGKSGILVPLKNVDLFAEKMIFLANNKKELEKYTKLSHKRIQHFTDKEAYIKKYNEVINTVSN